MDVSYGGEITEHGPVQALPVAEEAPQCCVLHQNYPNPFNPTTMIRYQIGKHCCASLTIYNSQGQLVRNLLECTCQPGHRSVRWDARDNTGCVVASGIYFCVLKVDEELFQMKKMALIR